MGPGPGDGERARIDREMIVAAAIGLADAGGLPAVTMRAVGQCLGVEAMSLYHHVANKDALLGAMVDALFAEIESPDPSGAAAGDWRPAIRRRMVSARSVLRRHPWAIALMDSRASPGPATLHHHDRVLGCLREAGFSVRAAASAYSLLDSYVYGFALQEANLPFDTPAAADEVAGAIVGGLDGAHPYLAELATQEVVGGAYEYARQYEIGLDLVLDAVATLRDAPPRRRRR